MKIRSIAHAGIAACVALAALAAAIPSSADARSMRSGGGMPSQGATDSSAFSRGTIRTNVMGPGGNGPVIEPTQTWRNNQGGLLGGGWPPPKRHPCTTPGSPVPGYWC
jgi:hypothetical protein